MLRDLINDNIVTLIKWTYPYVSLKSGFSAQTTQQNHSIYAFKKGKHEKFTKDEGIVFTINGQTHGYLTKAFFNRKGVGMNYLADSILVILDCSEIDGRERENLFMNSRDRLSACPLKTEIENAEAKTGTVIHKRKGKGDVGEWYATMPVYIYLELLRDLGYE